MKVLFVADIVGSPGREALKICLPKLKEKHHPDCIIVNGENAAGGRGITGKIAKEFYSWGVDIITLGNHTWDQKEIFDVIDKDSQMIRPANFAPEVPGQGIAYFDHKKGLISIINLQGTTFLPPNDNPFRKADDLLKQMKPSTKYIFVDFHAEATSEKQAMGWYLDGRVSAVIGTHTHVQTADIRILPKGTGYMTDVGMVGPRDGILGMNRESVVKKFLTGLPVRFEVESGPWILNAVLVTFDLANGKTTKIQPIQMEENEFIME